MPHWFASKGWFWFVIRVLRADGRAWELKRSPSELYTLKRCLLVTNHPKECDGVSVNKLSLPLPGPKVLDLHVSDEDVEERRREAHTYIRGVVLRRQKSQARTIVREFLTPNAAHDLEMTAASSLQMSSPDNGGPAHDISSLSRPKEVLTNDASRVSDHDSIAYDNPPTQSGSPMLPLTSQELGAASNHKEIGHTRAAPRRDLSLSKDPAKSPSQALRKRPSAQSIRQRRHGQSSAGSLYVHPPDRSINVG